MHLSGLLALLLSSTLSSTSAAGPARSAPKPEASPAPRAATATEVELEVVERSGKTPSSFGFVVPIDGEIEAWIDRDDDPRRCTVKANTVREGLRIDLRCDASPARALRVEATRTLTAGKRTRIAEISRPGGKSEVFVTLR